MTGEGSRSGIETKWTRFFKGHWSEPTETPTALCPASELKKAHFIFFLLTSDRVEFNKQQFLFYKYIYIQFKQRHFFCLMRVLFFSCESHNLLQRNDNLVSEAAVQYRPTWYSDISAHCDLNEGKGVSVSYQLMERWHCFHNNTGYRSVVGV